jgi:hypothetical protein
MLERLDWYKIKSRVRSLLGLIGLAVLFDRLLLLLQQFFVNGSEDESLDYVLVFDSNADDADEDARTERATQKRLILAGVVQCGLSVEQIDDAFWNSQDKKDDDSQLDDNQRVTAYAVTAPIETLMKGAELFRVRKAVRVILT